jgi:hypothetical protein
MTRKTYFEWVKQVWRVPESLIVSLEQISLIVYVRWVLVFPIIVDR